jgi:hypothetical protein
MPVAIVVMDPNTENTGWFSLAKARIVENTPGAAGRAACGVKSPPLAAAAVVAVGLSQQRWAATADGGRRQLDG